MDAHSSQLIQTKICISARRPRSVSRLRLLKRLDGQTGITLSLVCAPAGYGKSTLLAEWAHAAAVAGNATAWYSIDPTDDSPLTFGSYLVASLEKAIGTAPELAHTSQLIRSSTKTNLPGILPAFINAVTASGRKCVLILDDYHLISSPEIHSAVAFLLEHLPENMQLVIGSRSDPPLPLARLRARGQLLELRARDLRFTREESAQFLNEVMRLELTPTMVDELENRTEGWIAGLQLAALSMGGATDKGDLIARYTGSHRYLVDYLMQEVVDHQPQEAQEFLLSTCHLERMCAPLCDAIRGGRTDSEGILRQLEQANVFIVPLDEQGTWYRYHHLFRDFLQNRAQKLDPSRLETVNRAASEWFSRNNYLREAVQYAIGTRDWEYAAFMVKQHCFTMMMHSELYTIAEWCSALPEDVLLRHPLLCIMQSWTLVFAFRRQNRNRIEALLHQAELTISEMEDKQAGQMLTDQIVIIRTYLPLAPDPAVDPQAQLALADEMLSPTMEGDPGRFSILLTRAYAQMAIQNGTAARKTLEESRQLALKGNLYFGVIESTIHLMRLAHARGQIFEVEELHRQAYADISTLLKQPERELPALGCLDIMLGCSFLEQNRLEEAERSLTRGLELGGWDMIPFYLLITCLSLFRLYQIQGQSKKAAGYLTRLVESWPDVAFCTRSYQILEEWRSDPNNPAITKKAEDWCKDFLSAMEGQKILPGIGPLGVTEVYHLAYLNWARMQLLLNEPSAALDYLTRQFQLAKANGLVARKIEFALLIAQARQAAGDDSQAMKEIEIALTEAQSAGFIRSFDQGPVVTDLLRQAVGRAVCAEYAKKIVKELEHSGPITDRSAMDASREHVLESGEHLSQRELDVLRLMAQGASNQAIAGKLFITTGTVKSHINHILVKLDAHNRTEAVAHARDSGLLEI